MATSWQDPAEGVKTVKNHNAFERRPFTIDELLRRSRDRLATRKEPHQLRALHWPAARGCRHHSPGRRSTLIAMRSPSRRARPANVLLVPIAAPLREHILSLPTADNPRGSSPSRARLRAITVQHGRVGTLSNQFSELLVDAGLREPRNHKGRGHWSGWEAHGRRFELSFGFRHMAVSLLKDAGVPDSVVQSTRGSRKRRHEPPLHPCRKRSACAGGEDASRNLNT